MIANSTHRVICRPCRSEFEPATLTNPRQCPQCGGPLLKSEDLQKFAKDTQQSLDRLRNQSAGLLILGGVIILVIQLFGQSLGNKDAQSFTPAAAIIGGCSILGGLLWWSTKQRGWMLLGGVVLQAGACLFYFVALSFLPEIFQRMGFLLRTRASFLIAGAPLVLGLLAWHRYRGYHQIMSIEKRRR